MAFLTDGRLALIAALQEDMTLQRSVKTWYDWGPGVHKRLDLEPAYCPVCSVVPAELDMEQPANVIKGFPQDVEIGLVTSGQDAEPCETLVAAAYDVIATAMTTNLSLAADGLVNLSVQRTLWRALRRKEDAWVRWQAAITVRLQWLRFSPI